MVDVLSVDPGGVTGVACLRAGSFTSLELDGWETAVSLLPALISEGWDAVTCESFVIRPNTHKLDSGAFSLTTDLIGVVRFLAYRNGIEFKRQTPSQAKGFASDDKLRTLGWYVPSKGGHRNDAARHLLTYCASKHYAPVLTKLTEGASLV